jgi:hypothetical protein
MLAFVSTLAFADTSTQPPLSPTVSASENAKVESLVFQPVKVLLGMSFVDMAGNTMRFIEDREKMCLVDQGNIKPIAKITISFEDGTSVVGKLATGTVQASNPGAPRLLTDKEMSEIHGEVATPADIAAYKKAHPEPSK